MFCLGTVSAQGIVDRNSLAKASYANLTGMCKHMSGRQLTLIKGYLFFEGGDIFGRMEKLDEFLFVIHLNQSIQVGEASVVISRPLLFTTKTTGNKKLSFTLSSTDKKWLDCDFSADPYKVPSK